jgi:hypothetical protein
MLSLTEATASCWKIAIQVAFHNVMIRNVNTPDAVGEE